MRRLLLPAVLLATGCQAVPYTGGDDAAAVMTAATSHIQNVRVAAEASRKAFDAILAPEANLRASYATFSRSTDQFHKSIADALASIDRVERSTNTYLEGYSARREEIRNIDLRAAMLVRREAVERQVADMKVELSNLVASSDALTRELTDLRRFFEVSLNPRAIAPAAPLGDKLDHSIENIRASSGRVLLELQDLAASLRTERPDTTATPAPATEITQAETP